MRIFFGESKPRRHVCSVPVEANVMFEARDCSADDNEDIRSNEDDFFSTTICVRSIINRNKTDVHF